MTDLRSAIKSFETEFDSRLDACLQQVCAGVRFEGMVESVYLFVCVCVCLRVLCACA